MMKPGYWSEMTSAEKQEYAQGLLQSIRGQLIVSQALYRAIQAMKKERHPETSNIQDMEILLEELFPIFAHLAMAQGGFLQHFPQFARKVLDPRRPPAPEGF